MPADLVVNAQIHIPRDELNFTFVRSSGPGGQNVNKVSSKAVLRWNVTQSSSLGEGVRTRFLAKYARRISDEGALLLTSQRYRDQPRNVDDCLEKLRVMILAVATPPKRRKKTRPSRGAVERRLKTKREQSNKKQQRSHRPKSDD